MSTTTKIECDWCGNNLNQEEAEFPREIDGTPVCDECYHEHREFTCTKCAEYEDVEHQHTFLVVYEDHLHFLGGQPVKPGIYEIVRFPYYGDAMIGEGWLYDEALRFVRNVDWEGDGYYPCGHLCLNCRNELKLRQSKKGKALHVAPKDA